MQLLSTLLDQHIRQDRRKRLLGHTANEENEAKKSGSKVGKKRIKNQLILANRTISVSSKEEGWIEQRKQYINKTTTKILN